MVGEFTDSLEHSSPHVVISWHLGDGPCQIGPDRPRPPLQLQERGPVVETRLGRHIIESERAETSHHLGAPADCESQNKNTLRGAGEDPFRLWE